MPPEPAAEEPYGIIIAGTGSHEKPFRVPQSALEKSPIIKGWIEEGYTPPSLRKGDALYFPWSDPEVVGVTVEYLKSTADGLIAILAPPERKTKDVLFYLNMYKFATCLGLSELCVGSFHKIKELTHDTKTFLTVLRVSTEEKSSLVEDRRFNDFLVKYIRKNAEVLKDSSFAKSTILQNSALGWNLCSLLLSSLGGTSDSARAGVNDSTPSPLLTPPSKTSARTTPEVERRKSPYSFNPLQKSSSPRQNPTRVKKPPQKEGARKFNATVEEVFDEYFSSKRASS
ncbi:uncharacterized protein BDZ99DRAFT_473503 [Mytilinidion resinicola]|uniref:Uncharacterized protein n=1 Tax=Mytilinidion resinicola TaxID=574789 RepID=A0A6A6YZU3_9PEZI|nr:uncharacterized protein BDZ99DRAFT_473503 [Mytilinidion resinicola]KAF2814442.1 hypothetical protein BDZ99DRAFT_473503 [Mytilinidion resinicola]